VELTEPKQKVVKPLAGNTEREAGELRKLVGQHLAYQGLVDEHFSVRPSHLTRLPTAVGDDWGRSGSRGLA
jgi:hypothetical protein